MFESNVNPQAWSLAYLEGVQAADCRNTPGILGYALVYAIAVGLVCVGLSLAESDQWFDEYTAGYVFLFAFALLGPVALVVVLPLLHFAIRRIRNQGVHVAVTGLVGLATAWISWMYLTEGVLDDTFDVLFVLGAGAATALGRAAVIPMVLRRRQPGYVPFWERDHNLV